jgi:hypothetical protein
MTKRSTEIYAELQNVLAKTRSLNAEADACQPIRRNWRLSPAENAENERRTSRLDQIVADIGKANGEAQRLRKEYTAAMAEEQLAPVTEAPVSAEMQDLLAKRDNLTDNLITLQAERVANVLQAAGGDKKAAAALERIARDEERVWRGKQDLDVAKILLDAREAEERKEFAERDADARFLSAQTIAEQIIAHDHNTDLMMRALAEHLAQRPALLRAIRKAECSIDDARMNMLQTVEILHRAAKAAGLADVLKISIRDAVPLASASRTLLRLAIRRPTVKDKAA